MSEALPGVPPPPGPVPPIDAAAVVLFRRVGPAPGEVEVFWLERSARLSFAAGFHAFPGGRVDESDAEVPVAGAEGLDAKLLAAAARELLEETGVLIAAGAEGLPASEVSELRRELIEGRARFSELLMRRGLSVRAEDFHGAGRWITPPFMPRRFDARFFLVEAPPGARAEVWPGELASGAWIRPSEALARWEAGTGLLHPPNLFAMQTMAMLTSTAAASARMSRPPHCPGHVAQRIEFQKGIRLCPLLTPTLPPATHTNAYVLGGEELLIVDPGAAKERELAPLFALVEGLRAEGARPRAVVLTHHHADHSGGARAVAARLAVPVWCHPLTAERLGFAAERLLREGELLELDGRPPMRFRVLHTPGHARGHLCLLDEASRAAIVGDMVAGLGTIVIDPPEGDMAEYLAQLARLRGLPVGVLYPAHGPIIPHGPAKLDEYLAHRAAREQQVWEAIAPPGSSVGEIVSRAYTDVPELLHPIAERSAEAILLKLVAEGRVERRGSLYLRSGAGER